MKTDEGYVSMSDMIDRYKQKLPEFQKFDAKNDSKLKRSINTKSWQELALELTVGLQDGKKKQGSLFKCCKSNERAARFAWEDCKELNKKYALYFLKVWSVINRST